MTPPPVAKTLEERVTEIETTHTDLIYKMLRAVTRLDIKIDKSFAAMDAGFAAMTTGFARLGVTVAPERVSLEVTEAEIDARLED